MSMSDPIADLLTRIRNAQQAHLPQVSCPSSRTKVAICNVLEEEGYIQGHNISEDGAKSTLTIELKYFDGAPVIEEIKRVSRPGLRQYRGTEELPKNRAGLGVVIVSTNRGVMTDRKARAAGIGGEVLCTVF